MKNDQLPVDGWYEYNFNFKHWQHNCCDLTLMLFDCGSESPMWRLRIDGLQPDPAATKYGEYGLQALTLEDAKIEALDLAKRRLGNLYVALGGVR